jgi:hypothetical protein
MILKRSSAMSEKIAGAQMRAARALLRWTALDLATAAKVGVATIRRVEVMDGEISATAANQAALRRALEAAGVEFIDENGGGAGVRLRKPSGKGPKIK